MLVKYIDNINEELNPSVCCIGYFDALHKGHQELIKEAVKLAKEFKVDAGLICFDPDPVEVITGKKHPHVLPFNRRIELMEQFGLDVVYIVKFDKTFMNQMPDVFMDNYLNRMNLKALVCGFDYSFGYKGMGKTDALKELGNFEVKVIEEYKFYNKKISSTRLRNTILSGNYRLVERLLGYEYYLYIIADKVIELNNTWLIDAHVEDDNVLLPLKYNNSHISINKGHIDYVSDTEYKTGDLIQVRMYESGISE